MGFSLGFSAYGARRVFLEKRGSGKLCVHFTPPDPTCGIGYVIVVVWSSLGLGLLYHQLILQEIFVLSCGSSN